MSKKRTSRLEEINQVLWDYGDAGATKKQIANRLGMSVTSHFTALLEELVKDGKATKQTSLLTPSRPLYYYPAYSSLPYVKRSDISTPLYQPEKTWTFDNYHCFLCGTFLDATNRTDEHVIPKWLQRKYNLFNQKLGLLNGTAIPYRQLLIPCCSTCNGSFLGELEKKIQTAHDQGFSKFMELPQILIFQWVAKIFYGILFRELSLFADRSDPSLGAIFTEDQLREFHTLHHFLQSVRLPFVFRAFQPWSIFVVETLSFEDERNFDFRDSLISLMFTIRMGEIGIIACLEDAGVQQVLAEDLVEGLRPIKLHPVQFDELAARIAYGRLLMNRTPKYAIKIPGAVRDVTEVVCIPLMGLSKKPLLDDWNQKTYAHILFEFWSKYDMDFEHIFYPPDKVYSMFTDNNENLLQFNQEWEIVNRIKQPDLFKEIGAIPNERPFNTFD